MTKKILVAVCFSLAFLAAATHASGQRTPRVGVELSVSTSALPVTVLQQFPAVASDGQEFLVVWVEKTILASQASIYAARFDARGFPLDQRGVLISSNAGETKPAVAFDGTNYVIVWGERARFEGLRDLVGVHVSRSGALVESQPFVIMPTLGFSASIDCSPDNCLVIGENVATRISRDGSVLDALGLALNGASRTTASEVIWSGSEYIHAFVTGPQYPLQIPVNLTTDGLRIRDDGSLPFLPRLTLGGASSPLPAVDADSERIVNLWDERKVLARSVRVDGQLESELTLEADTFSTTHSVVRSVDGFYGFWISYKTGLPTSIKGAALGRVPGEQPPLLFSVGPGDGITATDTAANDYGQIVIAYQRDVAGEIRSLVRLISASPLRRRVVR